MVIIDDREVTKHPEIEDLIGVPFTVERLDASDYAFLGYGGVSVGIERCEISNLIQKLQSGELEDQLYRCQEQFGTVILLKEGIYDSTSGLLTTHKQGQHGYFRHRVYPHTVYENIKALEIRLSEMGIEIIDSPNFECSMVVVRVLYQQRIKPDTEKRLFKRVRVVKLPVKLSRNPAVPRLMALVPRMPECVAVELVHKYESIWNILQAPERDLLKIDGLGKTLIRKLKENVGKP